MPDLTEIPKKDLPHCAVCGNREVVLGYITKKGNKIIATYYCHGEEDIHEWAEGGVRPEEAFVSKPDPKPKKDTKFGKKGK